jgi:hypothetical protein
MNDGRALAKGGAGEKRELIQVMIDICLGIYD